MKWRVRIEANPAYSLSLENWKFTLEHWQISFSDFELVLQNDFMLQRLTPPCTSSYIEAVCDATIKVDFSFHDYRVLST